jgi:hypothetical protein
MACDPAKEPCGRPGSQPDFAAVTPCGGPVGNACSQRFPAKCGAVIHRYLSEFDFRFNNRIALGVSDGERAALAVKGIEGKRLMYRLPH